MRVTRMILLGLLIVGLPACSGSNTSGKSGGDGGSTTKKDGDGGGGGGNAAKIVGTWEPVEKPDENPAVEFTKDGKFKVTLKGETADEGTYEVKDDKVTMTRKGASKADDPETIAKLTDTELELKDKAGKVEKFKKKK